MKRLVAVLAALLTIPTTASCASLNIAALSQIGPRPTGYDIILKFNNVLNLPAQAKVIMDGVQVGVVEEVAVAEHEVDVHARIDNGIAVPSNIHAELQQATVLGDIYIALERNTESSDTELLRSGDTVGLDRTVSPPPLEATLAKLAMFIGSGSVQRIQNMIIHVNRVTPAAGDSRLIAARVSTDLQDLAKNIDVVDELIGGVSDTASVLETNIPNLQIWVSPDGQHVWKDRVIATATLTGRNMVAVGSIYNGGFWLVPLLKSMGNALGAVQQSKWAIEEELPAWRQLFTDYFLPQDKHPAINITSVIGPDGRELLPNVHDVLRIIGAMP